MTDPLDVLQLRLGHRFVTPSLLVEALTHRSYAAEHPEGPHNERLEFLGDAIVNAAVTELLFREHPDLPEGALSWLKHRLVSTDSLATIGRELELQPLLRLGRGEEATGGRDRETVLENASEAVFGALFLDGGFAACQKAAERWFLRHVRALQTEALAKRGWKNPRNTLQELLEKRFGAGPSYAITSSEGPPHDPTFHAQVRFQDRELGKGTGPTKRAAYLAAAEDALLHLEEP